MKYKCLKILSVFNDVVIKINTDSIIVPTDGGKVRRIPLRSGKIHYLILYFTQLITYEKTITC